MYKITNIHYNPPLRADRDQRVAEFLGFVLGLLDRFGIGAGEPVRGAGVAGVAPHEERPLPETARLLSVAEFVLAGADRNGCQ